MTNAVHSFYTNDRCTKGFFSQKGTSSDTAERPNGHHSGAPRCRGQDLSADQHEGDLPKENPVAVNPWGIHEPKRKGRCSSTSSFQGAKSIATSY